MSGRHRRADAGPDARSGLRAEAVTVAHGTTVVLTDVSLDVPAGTMLAVTGSSGAGKTSLLRVLSGDLLTPAGTVTALDRTVSSFGQARALGVVSIPQGNELTAVLTALENVGLPLVAASRIDATAAGAAGPDGRERALAAMEAVGVAEVADQLVDELSGGEQQRVAVARGLAQRAAVLLADEPTSELDAATRERVLAALRAEAERGCAVVMATHDPAAADVCDAEVHLDDGRAVWRRPLDRRTDR